MGRLRVRVAKWQHSVFRNGNTQAKPAEPAVSRLHDRRTCVAQRTTGPRPERCRVPRLTPHVIANQFACAVLAEGAPTISNRRRMTSRPPDFITTAYSPGSFALQIGNEKLQRNISRVTIWSARSTMC